MTCRRTSSRSPTTQAKAARTKRLNGIVRALIAACQDDDLHRIAGLLTTDVTALVDGGGIVDAPTHPVRGRRPVAELLARHLSSHSDLVLEERPVNGSAGILVRRNGSVVGVVSLQLRRTRISEFWIVVNPNKLCHWNVG